MAKVSSLQQTLVVLCLYLCLPIHVHARSKGRGRGEKDRERSEAAATPFPPPSGQGLFSVVESLVQQVGEIKATQERDWSRIRRLERRGKSMRNDIDVTHADVIQLRQHITEINSRLTRLDDLTSDLQLEVSGLTSGQQMMREEIAKFRAKDRDLRDKVNNLEVSLTKMDDDKEKVEKSIKDVVMSVQRINSEDIATLANIQKLEKRVAELTSKCEGQVTRKCKTSSSIKVRDVTDQSFQNDHTQLPPPNSSLPESKDSHVAGEITLDSKGPENGQFGDVKETSDIYSGDGENYAMTDDISGDGEFIIVEEHVPDVGSGDADDVEVSGAGVTPSRGTRDGVTPTPLTTNPVPTLTQSSVTAPTTPTSPCPSAALISRLQNKIENIETQFSYLETRFSEYQTRMNDSLTAEDVFLFLTNETSRIDNELAQQDETLEQLQDGHGQLGRTVSRLSDQMASMKLQEFMEKLQKSLVGFTSNVLTLEQWREASQQMISATQRTEERLSDLARRVLDNTQLASELQFSVRDHQLLGERQYRVLQNHVIRLNNSLQDLQETVSQLSERQVPAGTLSNHKPGVGTAGGVGGELLTSRVDDLALQLVYSDNRLSHLEIKMLNASLSECRKSNQDLYQDATIRQMDHQLSENRRNILLLQETTKRLDLGFYRLHGNSKATQEVLRKVQGHVKSMEGVVTSVQGLRREVDNLLFQLPRDCDDYYSRGYRRSGDYIIYPRHAVHSVKVRCIMYTADGDNDQRPSKDDTVIHLKKKRKNRIILGKKVDDKDDDVKITPGGWTVVQQRNSGKVNFTRSWAEYAVGFGSTNTEYWLGNDLVHLMTSQRNYSLAITMKDIFQGRWTATYDSFALSGKEDSYRLTLSGYHGNATDTFNYSAGMTFSTYDRDTDLSSSPCARYNGGGWWYSHCQISNLNGPYDIGMIWFQREWKDWLQLREVVMMIKPR